MSLSGYLSQPPQPWAPALSNSYEAEASFPPYVPGTPLSECHVRIRRLPPDATESQLRLMLLFSQEVVGLKVLPIEMSPDPGCRHAIVAFKTAAGAQQAKEMLQGKSTRPNAVELIVEILAEPPAEFHSETPAGARRYHVESAIPQTNGSAPITSPGTTARQSSRFTDAFPPNGLYTNIEVDPDFYQNIFSPQSPIGNHLANQTLSLGKTLIHNTAEDDETRELLKDPVAYAENGATTQRRATAPHLPISRMANLSLSTANGVPPLSQYPHPNMTPLSAHGNGMSPNVLNGVNHPMNFGMNNFGRNNFPPVNPADQNPPCNTLYVGNLPVDTAEEELKSIFQKQRGYKRLCFRTKQNGPMCFVEFEDVTHATRALHELYGKPLHNSTKGGIRLSFSKNPLGVRSNQAAGTCTNGSMASMNGLMAPQGSSFQITSGPPPGLTVPPGLHRIGNQQVATGASPNLAYPANNVWPAQYSSNPSTSGSVSPPNTLAPTFQHYLWSDRT